MRWLGICAALLLAVPALSGAQPAPPELEHGASSSVSATMLDEQFEADQQLPMRPSMSFGWQILQMVVVLGAICALAYLLLGKLLPRLMNIQPQVATAHILRVVDRLPIDQRRSVLIIRMGQHHFLLGSSEHSVSLLSRLEAEDVNSALAEPGSDRAKLRRMARQWLGRSAGKV